MFFQKRSCIVFLALISVFLQGFLSYNGVREDNDGRGTSVVQATHKSRNNVCRQQPSEHVNTPGFKDSFLDSKNCSHCGRRKGRSHFGRVKKSRRPNAQGKSRGRLLRGYDRSDKKNDHIELLKISDVPKPLLKRLNSSFLETPLFPLKDNSKDGARRKSPPVARVVPRQRGGGGSTSGQVLLNSAAQNNQQPGSDDFLDGLAPLFRVEDTQMRVLSSPSFSDDALFDLNDLFNESDTETDRHAFVSDVEFSSDSDCEELESGPSQQDTLLSTQLNRDAAGALPSGPTLTLDQNGSLSSSNLVSSVEGLISVALDPEALVDQAFAFLPDYDSSDDGGDIPSETINRTSTPVRLVSNSAEGERGLSGGPLSTPEIVSPIDSPVDALSRQNSSNALSAGNDCDNEDTAAMQDATEQSNIHASHSSISQGGRPELTPDSERMGGHSRLDLDQGSTDFLRGSSASFGGVSSLRNQRNFVSAGTETFLRTTSLPNLMSRSSSLGLSESVSPPRQPSEQYLSPVVSSPDFRSAGSIEHSLRQSQDSLMSASPFSGNPLERSVSLDGVSVSSFGLAESVRGRVQGMYPSRLENVLEAQTCWSPDFSILQSSSEPSLNATLQTRPRDDSGLGDSQGHLLTPDASPRILSQETIFKPSTSNQNGNASEADQVLLTQQVTRSRGRDSESSSSEVDIEDIDLEFDADFDLEHLQNNNPLPTFDVADDESDQSFDDEWRDILQAAGQGMPDGNLRLLEENPDQDDLFRREGSLTGYESQDDDPEMPGCSGTAQDSGTCMPLGGVLASPLEPVFPVSKSHYLDVQKYKGTPRTRKRAQPENRSSLSTHNDPEEVVLPTTSSSSPRRMRRPGGVRSATPTKSFRADYGSANAQRRRSLQDERDQQAMVGLRRVQMRAQNAFGARTQRLKEAQERTAVHTRNRQAEAAERRRQNEARGRAVSQRGDQAAQDAAARRRQAYLEDKRQRAQRSQRGRLHIPGETENNPRLIAARPLGRSPEEEVS